MPYRFLLDEDVSAAKNLFPKKRAKTVKEAGLSFEELKRTKKILLDNEDSMRSALDSDPGRPQRERQENLTAVALQIFELRKFLSQVRPHVVKIKTSATKITEETLEIACYLLFCDAAQNFEAIFLLASDGFDSQVGVLIRTTIEALDLITLFLQEGTDAHHLKAWFAGQMIPNSVAQKSTHGFLNQGRQEPADVRGLRSGIYFALSSYAHVSYMSLIHSIEPYARDFDWSRIAGSHHVKNGGLPFGREILVKMILTLKQFYRFYVRDESACVELDDILRRASIT